MAILDIEKALNLAHAYIPHPPKPDEIVLKDYELRTLRRAGWTGESRRIVNKEHPKHTHVITVPVRRPRNFLSLLGIVMDTSELD